MANYLSPGVFSKTIDQSFYSDTVDPVYTIMGLFPIFSPRGPDNKVVQFHNSPEDQILRFYGRPKFDKYGQSYHNCMQWAEQNLSTAVCRLMPSDAQYANYLLSYKKSKIEHTTTKGTQTAGKVLVVNDASKFKPGMEVWVLENKYVVESIESDGGTNEKITFTTDLVEQASIVANTPVVQKLKEIVIGSIEGTEAQSFDAISKKVNTKMPAVTGVDEGIDVPFMCLFAIGRGADYNKYSVQFTKATDLEDTYPEFACYNMKIFDQNSKGLDFVISDEEFTFSFNPDAIDVNDLPLSFADVVGERSKAIQFIYDAGKIRKILCDLYDLDPTTALDKDIYTKDLFQGNTVFTDITKNRFKNGTDGSLWDADGNLNWGTDGDIADGKCAISLLYKFYTGGIDPIVYDEAWMKAKYIFDANYPDIVKDAMVKFTDIRWDIRAILDTGIKTSAQGDLTWRETPGKGGKIDSSSVAIYPNNGITIDKYSGKKINVTSTYNVCKLYARVKHRLGIHYAIGGFNNQGRLDEMDSIAYSPKLEEREKFTRRQLNTIISDPQGIFVMENITSQKEASALQQNHIADTVQSMRREVVDFCRKYILTMRIDDQSLLVAQGEISNVLNKWISNGACDYITVKTSASIIERQRQSFSVNIQAKFKSIAKQVNINFVVAGEGTSAPKN